MILKKIYINNGKNFKGIPRVGQFGKSRFLFYMDWSIYKKVSEIFEKEHEHIWNRYFITDSLFSFHKIGIV